jgi:hypothetical protein
MRQPIGRRSKNLAVWCQGNILPLDMIVTKEMNVDFRKRRAERAVVEQVSNW